MLPEFKSAASFRLLVIREWWAFSITSTSQLARTNLAATNLVPPTRSGTSGSLAADECCGRDRLLPFIEPRRQEVPIFGQSTRTIASVASSVKQNGNPLILASEPASDSYAQHWSLESMSQAQRL